MGESGDIMTVFGDKRGRSGMPIGHRIMTCLAQGGYRSPVSGGLFNLLQMSQQEEDVLSLEDSGSECFDTAEAGSLADEMEDCLSAVSEGLALAEVTGPPSSKMPAGAEAAGSERMIDSPGRMVRRKKNKGRSRHGPGRLECRKQQALIRQSQGGLCKGRPEGNRSHPGAPPVRGVLWRGVGSGSLTSGGKYSWGFPGFGAHGGGYWEGQVVCIADDHESPGGSGGPIWLCGRATEYHRVPGGS